MWKTEVCINTKASKESIWNLWKSVSTWNIWDNSVEYSQLDGPFEKGTRGVLKPKGGPKTIFFITELEKNKSFTNQSKLPLCTINFIHDIVLTTSGIDVVHRIEMKGVLTFLFSRIMGKTMAKELTNSVQKLIYVVENE